MLLFNVYSDVLQKKMPRFEAGLRRVSQHGSFLPRRQDNPRKPPRFPLRSGSKPTVTLTLNSHQSAIVPKVWQHQLTTTGKSLLARELPKRRRLSRSPPLSVSGSTGAIGRHTQTFKSLIHLPRAIRLASRNSDPSGGNLAKCASNH